MKNTSKMKTQNLQINNPRFITYSDEKITIDILGGVDFFQIERMICTLRITYQNYPPLRSTLDLYSDTQTEKLIRTICDKWDIPLLDVSNSVHTLINQLETYKLERISHPQQTTLELELTNEEEKNAIQFLKNKNLLIELIKKLNTTGILGEDDNAIILFLALSSYKLNNPFSVICLAKSGIGKSYILQKLSECMPPYSYSFHTKISANALYYFDSHNIQNKALFIEDLEWTTQMLQPLSTLQTQGRLVNTRATKDKDGMIHSTTFEVIANLCLLACAYSDKNFEEISLPFLCLNLNHSQTQDIAIMEYQKRCKAGQIKTEEIKQAQHLLKSVIATLKSINIINPFATLINLPEEIAYPRKSLLLLLNFIEVITYFFQYQREQITDKDTGEVFTKTHPEDIELAFKFLKNNLFRRADELTTTARGFYNWLQKYLTQAKTNKFTALDIRKAKPIHPRTLNRYLQELKLFSYIQITGGNKHREGFIYKLTNFDKHTDILGKIEQSIQNTLKNVWNEYNKQHEKQEIQEPIKPTEPQTEKTEIIKLTEPSEPTPTEPKKRTRIKEKEQHTLKLLLELEAQQPKREYMAEDFSTITGRSYCTEARHLKTLWENKILTRKSKDQKYYYTLNSSKSVSQNNLSDTQTPDR